jgi:hypothetical protein
LVGASLRYSQTPLERVQDNKYIRYLLSVKWIVPQEHRQEVGVLAIFLIKLKKSAGSAVSLLAATLFREKYPHSACFVRLFIYLTNG